MCRLTSEKKGNEDVLTRGQQGCVLICTPSIKCLPDHRIQSKLCAYKNKVKMMSLNFTCHGRLSQNHKIVVVRAVRILKESVEWSGHLSVVYTLRCAPEALAWTQSPRTLPQSDLYSLVHVDFGTQLWQLQSAFSLKTSYQYFLIGCL